MDLQYRPARHRRSDSVAVEGHGVDQSADSTLAYIDQGAFLALRALGRGPIVQYFWVYERGVDLDGLRRFQQNLQHTLISRLIECSSLPFGRHRWVRYDVPGDLAAAAVERARDEVPDWLDERSFLPLDPELGPPWHLGVQPLTGGGAAVSLVVSHVTADAGAGLASIVDAVEGVVRGSGLPEKSTGGRWQRLPGELSSAARSVRDLPAALAATVQVARNQRDDLSSSARATSARPGSGDRQVVVPRVYGSVDAQQWAERAEALGATRNVLFAGFATRVGYRLGRLDGDGRVLLSVPVSERTEGDTRANPLNAIEVRADPDRTRTDLSELRSEMKNALVELGRTGDRQLASLALIPYTPGSLVRRLEGAVLKLGKPVGCTNVGDIPEAANRPDGNDADFFGMRGGEAGMTGAILERLGGHLLVSGASMRGRVWLGAASWESDRRNTRAALADVVMAAAGDLGLDLQLL